MIISSPIFASWWPEAPQAGIGLCALVLRKTLLRTEVGGLNYLNRWNFFGVAAWRLKSARLCAGDGAFSLGQLESLKANFSLGRNRWPSHSSVEADAQSDQTGKGYQVRIQSAEYQEERE